MFKKFLLISGILLIFSGFMDILVVRYMVPSWTIGGLALCCGLVFVLISKELKKEVN